MLEPIETWTRKSLQFQPPTTQPSGVSTQPLRAQDERGRRGPSAAATIQAGASARSAATNPARVGRASGASQRWRTERERPTLASASRTALTMIDAAPEAADPGDDVHEVGRDVDAGDDRGADRTRERQVRARPAG